MIDFSEKLKRERGIIDDPEGNSPRERIREMMLSEGDIIPPAPDSGSHCEQAALAYFAAARTPQPKDEIEEKYRRVRALYLEFLGNNGVMSIGADALQNGLDHYLTDVAERHGIPWKPPARGRE